MKSKAVAGLLGIFLGSLGVHKFYLGYTTEGVIMLAVTLLSLGTLFPTMQLLGLVEGIIYLTKPQTKFQSQYCESKRGWF